MFKIKTSIIGALVFANMAMTLALEPTQTPVLPSMVVGCLRTPGDVTSNFDVRSPASEVVCDEAGGLCAGFLAAIEALPDIKDRLVKSIFGCNKNNLANTPANSQKLFDRVKNDGNAIATILNAVQGNGIIMTGRGDALTTACSAEGYSCCPPGGCSLDGDSFTITPDSCTSLGSCINVAPKAMIFDSCIEQNSCNSFGQFDPNHPDGSVAIGSKIIGPNACTARASCQKLGMNIYGSIDVQSGACSGLRSCRGLGRRQNQGEDVSSPIIADIIIGENACQEQAACMNAHRGDSKIFGNLFIGDGACASTSSCKSVAHSNAAVDDLVIAPDTCIWANSCQGCVMTDMCTGPSNFTYATYTIDDPSTDCPNPNQAACS